MVMNRRARNCGCVLLSLSALVLGAGCRERPIGNLEDTRRLGAIQYAYQEAIRNLRRPPRNVDEIKPHLATLGDPETLLVSPRDGQRYMIVWNVDLESASTDPPTMYAWEAVGAGGKRYVLTTLDIAPVDNAEFIRLGTAKIK
jgi:hypothetical protein